MKQIIRLEKMKFGHVTRSGGKTGPLPYARLEGYNGLGERVVCFVHGDKASAINQGIDARLAAGQELHESLIHLEVSGEMAESKKTNAQGKPYPPFFKVADFAFLSGPALEVRKLRHEVLHALTTAKSLAAEGDYQKAFEAMEQMGEKLVEPLNMPLSRRPAAEAVAGKAEPSDPAPTHQKEQEEPQVAKETTLEEVAAVSQAEAAPTAHQAEARQEPQEAAHAPAPVEPPVEQEAAGQKAVAQDDTSDMAPEERAAAILVEEEGDRVFTDSGPEEEAAREMNLEGSPEVEEKAAPAAPEAPAARAASGPPRRANPFGGGDPFAVNRRPQNPAPSGPSAEVPASDSGPSALDRLRQGNFSSRSSSPSGASRKTMSPFG